MELWEEQLRKQMRELPKLDPPFLQTRLMARIQQEQAKQTRQRRVQIWSTAVTGLSLALLVIVNLPHWSMSSHSNSSAPTQTENSTASAGRMAQNQQASFRTNQPNLWPTSDLLMTNITLQQDPNKGITVMGQLLNQSETDNLSSSNTQGMLFFYQNGTQIASYFTDAPGQPVPPRGEVSWSYQIPSDSWQPNNLKNVQVVWSFVKRVPWNPSASTDQLSATQLIDSQWHIGVSPLQATATNLTGTGTNQMYMTLKADIVNPTNKAITDQDLMAYIFLPKASHSTILDPLTYKFMVDLNLQNGKIEPDQHQTVRFHFIGNETLNLTGRSAQIVIVAKSVAPG